MLKVFCEIRRLRIINKHLNTRHCFISNMEKIEDNRLKVFCKVCNEIGEESSYLNKAKILQDFFRKGSDGSGFRGDTLLWIQLLIPSANQRVYNLQNKQMLKLFSRLFTADQQEMQHDLEQEGDVSETIRKFFESSPKLKPQDESTMYLQEVDDFLVKLEQKTKEDEQTDLLRQLCKQTTALDLKMIIRMIKQDLKINARARHILDGLGPLAYPAYQSSHDLVAVVKQFAGKSNQSSTAKASASKATKKGAAKIGKVQVMTPISPMLASACNSVEEAFKKSPGGLFSEIKYDGERVQIHKRGNDFKFFSRNLKPVMEHKVKRFKEFIPKAFPGGGDMILDSEIILVDTVSGELLPFGSLGAHKKKEYAKAEVCLFVFDCILYDSEDLTNMTFRERRQILEDNIKPVKSYVQLSESRFLKTKNELSVMTAKVLKANLEGVVLKNPSGTYQPGKRNWLKVKKDYLFGGKMADTADLVVLGAWFGSGKKGGVLSIFLMGTYDPKDRLWKTVTKVHSGLDDETHDKMHEKLMKLMERSDANKTPAWILCKKQLVPDYIAIEPKEMPVFEITGAEFTKSESHTAAGISIRFPRITKLRDDKSAEQANDLPYLQQLYDASKKDINVDLLMAGCDDDDPMDEDAVAIESKINLNISPQKKEDNKASTKSSNDSPKSGKEKKQNGHKSAEPTSSKKSDTKGTILSMFKKMESSTSKRSVEKTAENARSEETTPIKKIVTKVEQNSSGKKSSKLKTDGQEESPEASSKDKNTKTTPSSSDKKLVKGESDEKDSSPVGATNKDISTKTTPNSSEKKDVKGSPVASTSKDSTKKTSPDSSRKKLFKVKSEEEAESPVASTSKQNSSNSAPNSSGKKLNKRKSEAEVTNSSKKFKIEAKSDNKLKPQHKQMKLDFSAHKIKKSTGNDGTDNIFKDLVAFFDAGIAGDKDILDKFTNNGGTVTKDASKADFAFYASANANVDLEECRENYKTECRHLSVQWLRESIAEKKLQPFPLHAVVLKST